MQFAQPERQFVQIICTERHPDRSRSVWNADRNRFTSWGDVWAFCHGVRIWSTVVNETDVEYHENSREGLVADTTSQTEMDAVFRTEGVLSPLKEGSVMTVSTLQQNVIIRGLLNTAWHLFNVLEVNILFKHLWLSLDTHTHTHRHTHTHTHIHTHTQSKGH
jgi:hypothetical protein